MLLELARIGFSDVRRVMSWGPDGVRLRPSGDLTDDEAAMVAEVSQTVTKGGGTLRLKTMSKMEALKLIGQVVVDAGGIGRGIVDQLEVRGLTVIAVTLTGGQRVHVRRREVSLPRMALFLPLRAAVEAGRYGWPRVGLHFGPERLQELLTA